MLWVLVVFSVIQIVNSIGSYLNHRTSMHYHSAETYFSAQYQVVSYFPSMVSCPIAVRKKVVFRDILYENIYSLDFSSSPLKKYTLLSKTIIIHKYNSKYCHSYFDHNSNQDLIHTIKLCWIMSRIKESLFRNKLQNVKICEEVQGMPSHFTKHPWLPPASQLPPHTHSWVHSNTL